MSDSPILQLQNVHYVAGGKAILRDVSWGVSRGEHWAILGPNGSGKTTLLKIACGYTWPTAVGTCDGGGKVLREGHELTDLRELRKSIGWVTSALGAKIPPREPALNTVVSGVVAQTGLKIFHGTEPSKTDYERARSVMSELNLDALVERPFGVLSQGEQQAVLLARARMALPLLMILDEPCAGLDPAARERLLKRIEALAQLPTAPSIVFVTHHLEEIMPSFLHTLLMKEGQVLRQGPTREILSVELVGQLYDAPPCELIERRGRVWPVW